MEGIPKSMIAGCYIGVLEFSSHNRNVILYSAGGEMSCYLKLKSGQFKLEK
jgi:hypothetical protein